MRTKNPVSDLLQQEMDRKEFLARVGVAGLAAFGIGNVIKALSGRQVGGRAGNGYGGSSYGGQRKLGKINRNLS